MSKSGPGTTSFMRKFPSTSASDNEQVVGNVRRSSSAVIFSMVSCGGCSSGRTGLQPLVKRQLRGGLNIGMPRWGIAVWSAVMMFLYKECRSMRED